MTIQKKMTQYVSMNKIGLISTFIILSIFIFYFISNFILSEGWEIISIRSIDDYAIQLSLRKVQDAISTGNWRTVFGSFGYAYGNAFWVSNAVLLYPLYLLDSPQTLIIVGRQISLIATFATIFLVKLIIDKLRPDADKFKYPVLILMALMPIVAINATKFHVNSQTIFFGILSVYFLIKSQSISRKELLFSAIFAGVSIGFKATSLIILPFLFILLVTKKFVGTSIKLNIKIITLYFILVFLISAFCTSPALLIFPFFIDDLETYILGTFLLYKNLGVSEPPFSSSLIVSTVNFFISKEMLPVIIFGYFLLFIEEVKNKKLVGSFIFILFSLTLLALIFISKKSDIYLATYVQNIGLLLPIGLLGFVKSKLLSKKIILIVIYIFIFLGARHHIAIESDSYGYYKMKNRHDVIQKIESLDEIRLLIQPLKKPVSALVDFTAVFPATNFDNDVSITYIYDNLYQVESNQSNIYDYIVLNSVKYKLRNDVLIDSAIGGRIKEDSAREKLIKKHTFGKHSYNIIYDKNNLMVLARIKE